MNITLCPVWPHWMPSFAADVVIDQINHQKTFEIAETTFYSKSTWDWAVDSLSERFSEAVEEGNLAVPIGYYGGGAVAAEAVSRWHKKTAALVMIATPMKNGRGSITKEVTALRDVLSIRPGHSLLGIEYIGDGEVETYKKKGVFSMLFTERLYLEINGWLEYKIKPRLDLLSYH